MTLRVVVTGAGSGFGAAIASALLARGDRVVGADLDVGHLRRVHGGAAGFEAVQLDLREPGSVSTAAREILAGGGVDALVNNAGYAVFGTLDDADLDAVAAMLDANVLGQVRVTRPLLPALRVARGTIVYVSSVAGRMVFPESGFYAASKHALEAVAEGTFVENAADGVRVAVVEPGAFATGFAERARRASRPRPEGGPHAGRYARWDARKQAMLAPPQDPSLVAAAVLGALDGGPAFQRVVVGDDARAILDERRVLGDDAWVRALGERFAR